MATIQPTLDRRAVSARFFLLAAVSAFAILITGYYLHTMHDTLSKRGQNEPPPGPAATAAAASAQETMEAGVQATLTALAPTATLEPTFTPTPTVTATPTVTPTPTATAIPKAGSKRVSKIDGMTSLYVPAGKFMMGRPSGGHPDYTDIPRHPVTLNAFWMNRNQVTNAQYAKCVKAKACNPPIRKEINPHYYDPAYARHPVVYISWENAVQYCRWVGGRLPTEAEWEYAAGGGKRTYPWGDRYPYPDLANISDRVGTTVKVGSYPDGASPFGVQDMGGNVREWVADWYDPNYYDRSPKENPTGPKKGEKKVLRGAGYNDPPEYSAVYHRLAHVPGSPGANRGFRCAFSE